MSRGQSFMQGANELVGMKLTAICDTWKKRLDEVGKQLSVATYTDYDRFLEHDMDAVILANYFHEHAPFALKALNAGKHVMSEISACKTLGEGVALARTVERTGLIYMFAENCCYFVCNQEMRRLYRAGEIGEMQFGECEYVHPSTARDTLAMSPGFHHWRNWIPSTYYCTHALGPVMYITDTRPVSVNAQSIAWSRKDAQRIHVRMGDPGSTILCRMDNGAMVHVLGLGLRGHSLWYRIHGTRGLMENLRHGDRGMLRVHHEPWDLERGDVTEKVYAPDFPKNAALARGAGHGGADFFTSWHFAQAIRTGRQPWLDVYRGLAMSIVGIQAWKSALSNGAPCEVPDLRKESVRRKYEGENWSPFAEDRGPGQPPPSIEGWRKATPKQRAFARKVWREMGR